MKIRFISLAITCVAATAGCVLLLASEASAQFVDVSSQVGLSSVAKKSWGNPIWGDLNNDGFLDLIVPTHGLALSHGPFVYLNHGGTQFTDNLTNSNIGRAPELDSRDWHGFSFGDYNGDGNLDLYIAEGAKGSRGGTIKEDLLFRGNGDGTFTNASIPAGMQSSMHRGRCAIWFDSNNTGRLDLFVKNYADVNDFYANNGDGTFTLVPDAGGLANATGGGDLGSILSIADYDNDGLVDLAITGDNDAQSLYRNLGNRTFVDVTAAAGIAPAFNAKGMAWGDYDNDGKLDLFIARGHQGDTAVTGSLYHNNGDLTFTDKTSAAGLAVSGNSWAATWGDYDNDGYLDLFVTNAGDTAQGPGNANRLFHNNANGTFTDVAATLGAALQDNISLHKGVAWADYNNDGFLDLLIKDGIGSEEDTGDGASGVHRLLRNTPNGNHFIKVTLRGVQSNRQGIGARVTVTTPEGLTCYRQNTGDGGGNYSSQGSQPLHFGIGAASEATVTVTWPGKGTDTVPQVAANSTVEVVENGIPTPTPTPTATPSPTPAPPVITKQPANRTVNVGQTARFQVAASGELLTYQWKKNGAEIVGATSSLYVTPPATLPDSGSNFVVVVSNPGGSATSKTVQLLVNAGPIQP